MQLAGSSIPIVLAEKPRHPSLPPGFVTPALTHRLHAPSMLFGHASNPSEPSNTRLPASLMAQPVTSPLRGGFVGSVV